MAVAAAARPAGDAPLVPPGFRVDAVLLRSAWRISMRAERLADGAMVVLKTVDAQYPTRQQVAELQREHRILQRLQSVPGVVRLHGLLRFGNGNLAIETAWVGRSLAHTLAQSLAEQGSKPGLPLAQVLELAAALAQTLGQVHEHDIVHKNIEPRSVVLDGAGQSSLIDFGFASELSLERQNDSLERRLEGALPYLSPEQTGRMNRDLDYRSDFYSLGILLFELLTGRLPFEASSALEWVHSHISRPPPAASELNPTVPMAVSALVHKLLAKNAEDRYQSSFGLLEDLSRCTRELAQTGHIAPFALGHRDVSRRFSIAQKLYGRQAELATLMLLFEQVAAGETVICMVSGFSGVGKSALVMEIQKPLVRRGGFLIQGKFDQFQRGTPYSALAAALGGLARQLLAEPEPQRQAWCESLLVALTPNARLLLELAPEFEPLLGPQPAVPELPPAEAHNRFQITLINFIRVMTAEQPLVVFLDDLQFSDAATLKLIRWLGGARELPRLMLIGAYRSNEVDAGHPLRLALEEIRTSRPIHDLQLRPLGMESVEQLLADSLHTDAAACRPLAQLMHERTEGNPFFIAELLKTVVRSKAISFVPEAGRWRWDLEAVRATTLSGNVVDFVLANLRRLQPETQRALQLAACIGSSFDLHTLAVIHESSPDHTAIALLPALQRNVVIPLLDNYRLVGTGAAEALPGDINPTYRFQHDRVQQAAYALIDDEDKQAVHLSVGRLILGDADVAQRQARLIDIVGHLNQGLRLITDPVERLQLARLNLDAGIQAQRSTAYGSALQYLSTGQALLPADAWAKHYKLAMALALEHQQCAYLTARYDEAEAAIEQMLARAQTALEKAEILAMRTRQYATTGKMEASIRSAIMGLALLGLRISGDPDPAAIQREAAAVRRNLAGRRIANW